MNKATQEYEELLRYISEPRETDLEIAWGIRGWYERRIKQLVGEVEPFRALVKRALDERFITDREAHDIGVVYDLGEKPQDSQYQKFDDEASLEKIKGLQLIQLYRHNEVMDRTPRQRLEYVGKLLAGFLIERKGERLSEGFVLGWQHRPLIGPP